MSSPQRGHELARGGSHPGLSRLPEALDLSFTSEQSTALLLQTRAVKSASGSSIRFQPDLEVEDRAAAEKAALEELRAMERGLHHPRGPALPLPVS